MLDRNCFPLPELLIRTEGTERNEGSGVRGWCDSSFEISKKIGCCQFGEHKKGTTSYAARSASAEREANLSGGQNDRNTPGLTWRVQIRQLTRRLTWFVKGGGLIKRQFGDKKITTGKRHSDASSQKSTPDDLHKHTFCEDSPRTLLGACTWGGERS